MPNLDASDSRGDRAPERPGPGGRSWVRAVLAAAALGLACAALFADQLALRAARALLPGRLPWRGATVAIGSVRLRPTTLRVTALRLAADPANVLTVDTVFVRFSLDDPTRRLANVRAAGVRLTASQGSAGWTWLLPFDTSTSAPSRRAGSFRIDALDIARASLTLAPAGGRQPLTADSLHASLRSLAFGAAPSLTLRSATLRVAQAGKRTPRLSVGMSGRLAAGAWTIDSLLLDDRDGGRMRVSGSVGPNAVLGTQALALTLRGTGFHLARLSPVDSGAIRPDDRGSFDLRVGGELARPTVDGSLRLATGEALRLAGSLDRTGRAPVLAVRGTGERVDIARVTGGTAAWPVSGTFGARLALVGPDSLDGPIVLDLRTSVGGQPAQLTGHTDFARGVATIDLTATLRGATLRAKGRLRPAGATQPFDVELRSRLDLPLAAAVADRQPELRGPWDTRVRITGEGFSPSRMRARFEGRAAAVGRAAAGSGGRIAGDLSNGVVRLDGTFALAGGRIVARGRVPLADPARRWTVPQVRVRDVPLAPWLGGRDAGRLNADLTLAAAGGGITMSAVADPIRGGTLDGVAARLNAEVRGTRTRLRGTVRRAAAAVHLETVDLIDGGVGRVIAGFDAIDPAAFAAGAPRGNLRGRVALAPLAAPPSRGPATGPLGAIRLAGRVTLDSSTLGAAPVSGGVAVSIRDGIISLAGGLAGAGQSLGVSGTLIARGDPIVVQIDSARLVNLDPAAWSDGRLPAARLSGLGRGRWTGASPATAAADLVLRLDSSRVGPADVAALTATVSLDSGVARIHAAGTSAARRGAVDAVATLRPSGGWGGTGTAFVVGPRTAGGSDSVYAAFEVVGPDSGAGGAWRAALTGAGRVDELQLDSVVGAVAFRDRVLTVERMLVLGTDVELRGGGALPLAGAGNRTATLAIDGTSGDLRPVLRAVGLGEVRGQGTVALRSSGRVGAVRHELAIGVSNFRSPWLEVDTIRVEARATGDSTALVADAAATVSVRGRRPLLVGVGNLPVLAGIGFAGLTAESRPDSGELRVEWNASKPRTVTLARVQASIDDERWALARPTAIAWGDSIVIGDLALASPSGGRVTARGHVTRTGDQDVTLDVQGLAVQVRRSDARDALAGRLSLRGRMTGPAASPTVTVRGAVASHGDARSAPVTLAADWNAAGLRVDVRRADDRTGAVAVTGALPLRLSLVPGAPLVALTEAAIDLRVRAAREALDAFAPLLDASVVDRLAGTVSADVRVTGTTSEPRVDGQVTVRRFGVRLPRYDTRLSADSLRLTLTGQRITATDVLLRSPRKGTLRVTGGVDLPDLRTGRLDLRAQLKRFEAARSDALALTLSGDMALTGTADQPNVSGKIRVDRGTYHLASEGLPSELEAVTLTDADYAEVARRFDLADFSEQPDSSGIWAASTVDVEVSALSDVWIQRTFAPSMSIEVTGTVRVRKTGEDLRLDGTLQTVEGRGFVEEYGRRFQLARGTLTFDGRESWSLLDAEATYKPNEDVTIRLQITGVDDSLSLVLSSDPSMDETDIISYIAVGAPANDVLSDYRLSETRGLELGLSRATSGLQDLARASLGLDVAEVRQDGIKGLTLAAGRYVNGRLYLGFQQGVGFRTGQGSASALAGTEIDAEYRVARWLLVNLSASRSLVRFFFRSRNAY